MPVSPLSPGGFALLASVFLLLLWAQWRRPLRALVMPGLRRLLTNLTVAGVAAAPIRLLVIPAGLAASAWAADRGVGLLHWVDLPTWAEGAIGFVLMDFSFYYWHRLNHTWPLLWRFHNVHHIDPDLDVSTALRFHFGEIALSTVFRVLQVGLLGVSPAAFLFFELCFTTATEFHHSNWRLPFRLEAALNQVFVTPRMHTIHHTATQPETDSNYSSIFSWWDRVNGTFRKMTPDNPRPIGVPAYRDTREETVLRLLLLPFRRQRDYWRS